jgi:hypothetical protein
MVLLRLVFTGSAGCGQPGHSHLWWGTAIRPCQPAIAAPSKRNVRVNLRQKVTAALVPAVPADRRLIDDSSLTTALATRTDFAFWPFRAGFFWWRRKQPENGVCVIPHRITEMLKGIGHLTLKKARPTRSGRGKSKTAAVGFYRLDQFSEFPGVHHHRWSRLALAHQDGRDHKLQALEFIPQMRCYVLAAQRAVGEHRELAAVSFDFVKQGSGIH